MVMIEVEESKVDKMSENIEKALKYLGKAMQCIDEVISQGGMGERGNYGLGGAQITRASGGSSGGSSYGNRRSYGNRWDDDDDDDEMGERRRRRR